MPLPCELPLSGSSSNPVSLPGAIAALSAQVTSTLLEVRQEIGELKCEFVGVRGLAIELAASLIKEQTQKVKYLFDQRSEDDLETRKRQEIICQFAISTIKEQTQKVEYLFDQRSESDIENRKRQEIICQFAVSAIKEQTQKVKYLFDQQNKADIETAKRQEIICQFAASIIRTQTILLVN